MKGKLQEIKGGLPAVTGEIEVVPPVVTGWGFGYL